MKLSFRTKVILALSLIIIVIFSLMGISMTLSRAQKLREEIFINALMFVNLTYDKIGDSFCRYYRNAFFKFRSLIYEQKVLSKDLENIQLLDTKGTVYYDMQTHEAGFTQIHEPHSTTDSFVLRNLKKMEITAVSNRKICIIAPYIDDSGMHNYSVVYYFNLNRLQKELSTVLTRSITMALTVIILSILLSILVSNRITSHLRILDKAARKIAEGDFDQKINIRTGDEFEKLARAFNFMSERIGENITELNRLVSELEKRDAQKTQFLANISHELRTPLTASLGYVDYLEKERMGSLNSEQKQSLNVIRRNLERLNKEIHSLLQISKYTLEGIKIGPELFKIDEMIESIIKDFAMEIKSKEITVKQDFAVDEVYGDRNNLRTVIENLISNGIKFSQKNTAIEISTSNVIRDSKMYFQFSIKNHGVVIPDTELDRIFEPFYQIDATTSRKYGGIGLGLSIARSIIEAHKGKIWAENDSGGNAKFIFIIPQGGNNG